jgi:hypothetical protein
MMDDRTEHLYRGDRRQDSVVAAGDLITFPHSVVSRPPGPLPHVAYYQLNSKLSNQSTPEK